MADEYDSPYGTLFLVATPIGHPEDITLRALSTLRAVPLVVAEDTPRARWLLSHFEVRARVVHCDPKAGWIDRVVQTLATGQDAALVCSAGTPGVADNSAVLIAAVADAGYRVVSLPGPSAVSTAMSLAGFDGGGYHFLGRPPRGRRRRADQLRALIASPFPLLVFESAPQIRELLSLAAEVLGDRQAVLCRELTKPQEEVLRGTLRALAEALPSSPQGELTLVIAGLDPEAANATTAARGGTEPATAALHAHARARATELITRGLSRRDAARQLAAELGGALDRRAAHALTQAIEPPIPEHTPAAVSFRVRGNPAIRATHANTLEFKRESEVSERETCVVGVNADWDPVAVKTLSGKVRVSIRAGALEDALDAEISKGYRSGARMVLRKSARPSDATLGIHATKGSADLNRDLIRALTGPKTTATVTITPLSPDSRP